MGCFGYMCPVCNTQIVGNCFKGGELCRLKHIRHGELIGETVGHYNEYGGVMEDPDFRSSTKEHANSHSEICDSEMSLAYSFNYGSRKKLPSGAVLDTYYFSLDLTKGSACREAIDLFLKSEASIGVRKYMRSFTKKIDELEQKLTGDNMWEYMGEKALCEEKFKENAPLWRKFNYSFHEWARTELPAEQGDSGIIAVHEYCYQSLSDARKENLPFSLPDPDQSWGTVRKKFL